MANLGMMISQMSGYRVRTGYPLTTFSSQGIDGLMDTSATTVLGLLQAALEEVAMSCATQAAPKTIVETAADIDEENVGDSEEIEEVEEVERKQESGKDNDDEYSLDDFFNSCCNHFREIFYTHFLWLHSIVTTDMKYLFAHALKLVWKACAECKLDVFRKAF